ncbi:MAG: FecR domain-containing protein [Bacteroidota bacterium]
MDKIRLNKYTRYFLEGKLSSEKESELLSWVKKSPENRKLFLKAQEEKEVLSTVGKNPELNKKWNTLQSRIFPDRKNNKTRLLFLRVASVAAAFILGVILTVVVVKQSNILNNQSAYIQNITVPYGAKTNIELPDGSLVWLNSGSTFSYPSEFKKSRPVKLIGEAYFDVEKSDQPFIVSTNYGDVEVKGTSFNVKAFTNEYLQTTLVTGTVLVREKESKKEVTLRPGQQANLSGEKIHVEYVDAELFTSWKEGKLIFRNEYLPVVAKRLERWYNVKIELDEDKRLNKIWFNGTLEMESFPEVLQLLKVTSSIDYSYNEKTRIIKIFYNEKPN